MFDSTAIFILNAPTDSQAPKGAWLSVATCMAYYIAFLCAAFIREIGVVVIPVLVFTVTNLLIDCLFSSNNAHNKNNKTHNNNYICTSKTLITMVTKIY